MIIVIDSNLRFNELTIQFNIENIESINIESGIEKQLEIAQNNVTFQKVDRRIPPKQNKPRPLTLDDRSHQKQTPQYRNFHQ